MGKKCKKKVQWRTLPLNEPLTKSSSDDGGREDCDDEEDAPRNSARSVPVSHSRPQGFHPRRPFHPNFYPVDRRRYPPPLDQRGHHLDRSGLPDRPPHPRFFDRPFPHDPRPHFPLVRRRPFKFVSRGGGLYVRGPSPPYVRSGDASRRCEDDGVAELGFECAKEGEEDAEDKVERPSQPVHTVFIDNEEYTKIQTPRQEVIFKKSSLDRRRDSIDLGSGPSSGCSVSGGDFNSQGDQVSVAGSIEDATVSSQDEILADYTNLEQNPYEGDSNNIFMGEPGKPPLAGVVMQQAYPGGPMVSIPVHWTPFLDPGLIPGDTALTPLDPAFTHVIDSKDLEVDPAHILPVQHDSNGHPVTVQVKVNAEGLPIEIEPSAFTVSLSTLEPQHQENLHQEAPEILPPHGADPVPSHPTAPCAVTHVEQDQGEDATHGDDIRGESDARNLCAPQERAEANETLMKNEQEHKDSEDSYSDSQYASMSESSTAPTTPSAELSESSSDSSKSRERAIESCPEEDLRRVSHSDSLLDSTSLETEGGAEPDSCIPLISSNSDTHQTTPVDESSNIFCINESLSLSSLKDDSYSLPNSSICSLPDDESLTRFPASALTQKLDSCTSLHHSDTQESGSSFKTSDTNKRRSKKNKKCRSLSTQSSVSSQNSSFGDVKTEDFEASTESIYKQQSKKSSKLVKRDKKKNKKEKSKTKKLTSKMETKVCPDEHQEKLSLETEIQDSTVATEESYKDYLRTDGVEEPNSNFLSKEEAVPSGLEEVHPDTYSKGVDSEEFTEIEPEKKHTFKVKLVESSSKFNIETVNFEASTKLSKLESFEETDFKSFGDNNSQPSGDSTVISSHQFQGISSSQVEINSSEESEVASSDQSEVVSSKEPDSSEQSQAGSSEQSQVGSSDQSQAGASEQSQAGSLEQSQVGSSELPEFKSSELSGASPSEDSNIKSVEDSEVDNLEETSPSLEEPEDYVTKESSAMERDEGEFICKSGFVMVPILTPYYDPAIIYGYPLVIPETLPERNYSRKKKKKWKRKYHEEVCLDTDLYAGEPFVAAPTGYIIPTDVSQVCQMHGYQYLPDMFPPHMLPDEVVASVNRTPYFTDFVPEQGYHRRSYAEMEAYTKAKFARLYEEEKKEIKEVLQDHTLSKDKRKGRDFAESCDSGVSESEEGNQLIQGKNPKTVELSEKDASIESKVKGDDSSKAATENSPDENKDDKQKMKKEKKKRNQSQKKVKGRREVIEILEPDFSSFSGTVLRFESKEEKENKKSNLTKSTQSRKKKDSKTQSQKNNRDTSLSYQGNNSTCVYIESISEPSGSNPSADKETERVPLTQKDIQTSPEQTTGTEGLTKVAPIVKNNKIQTETKDNQQVAPTKKSRGSRKRSKGSKRAGTLKSNDHEVENGSEVAFSHINKKIPNEEILTLVNEDYIVSEESLSQESANMAVNDDILSQDSEITLGEMGSPHENENSSLKDENITLDGETSIEQYSAKDIVNILDSTCEEQVIGGEDVTSHPSPSLLTTLASPTQSCSKEPITTETVNNYDSATVQIPSLSPIESADEFASMNRTTPLNSSNTLPTSEKDYLVTSNVEKKVLVNSHPTLAEEILLFKDLGVTEAVKRWIREVTPEKAFALSHETRSLLFNSALSSDNIDCNDLSCISEVDISDYPEEQKQKNVQGNPSVASPSEVSPDVSSERVASSDFTQEICRTNGNGLRTSSTQDVLDDYDGESVISGLSRGRLYSSSSCSSFPLTASHLEDSSPSDGDPRVYDPTVYSKYYQLAADVPVSSPSSILSTRESTLSPAPLESVSEDSEIFLEDSGPPTPVAYYSLSLATELYKSQKIKTIMSHFSPSLCENSLPLTNCGSPSSALMAEVDQNDQNSIKEEFCDGEKSVIDIDVPACSVSSSGIGSSLASTPNISPAHQPQSSIESTTSRPKLEPYPLKNLSVNEGSVPCKAVCCSVM